MLKTDHDFSVWHPSQGGLPKHEVKTFGFTYPISRTEARRIVEKVEGYVIERAFTRKRTMMKVRKNRVQKI